MNPTRYLVIMRGVPGSGKSYYINRLLQKAHGLVGILSSQVCSADHYFTRIDETYDYNPKLISNAHQYCLKEVKQAMDDFDGASFSGDIDLIIIDNTNIKKAHMQPYIDLANEAGYKVKIITIPFRLEDAEIYFKRNKHGVPLHSIKRMIQEFEY